MEALLIIYGVSIIPSAIACHFIAKAKGYNPALWALKGFCFGLLAIPFALSSKPNNPKARNAP